MRRLLLAAAVVLSVLGCGNASATSEGIKARLVLPAGGIVAGGATTATIRVTHGRAAHGAVARVRFASAGATVSATARPAAKRGTYGVRFRLPIGGAWTYRITIGRALAGTGRLDVRVDSRLPGADAFAICPNAGAFWPTETLALDFGSAWIACKEVGVLRRFDTGTTIEVGDGPADLVFDGSTAWVINHRDRGLVRIDARTNTARLVATIPGDAPERMVWVSGHLWITGRGTDLLEVDPSSGAVLRTVEIGSGGIDVVAAGDTLWVPSRNSEVDVRGFPTMEALRRVDARSGAVTASIAATAPLDVHGLVADDSGVWLADNTHGVLYRVRR